MINFKKGAYVFISLFTILALSCSSERNNKTVAVVSTVNDSLPLQEYYLEHSLAAINALNKFSTEDITIDSLKVNYKEARKEFKYLEPILAYVDSENYKFLNQPNILKIEEEDFTDIKIKNPTGFQVIEEELYSETPHLETIKRHADNTSKRLQLIHKNINFKYLVNDQGILWMVRDQIIRTAVLGVTGFDSPQENSLLEAQITYASLQNILTLYKDRFKDKELYNTWISEIQNSIKSLDGNFAEFDRYAFIKTHTNKAFEIWNATVEDWKVQFTYEKAFKNNITSLFSQETFNQNYFSNDKRNITQEHERIQLGKKLFFDTALSSNNSISCGSCHQPDKAYTDGLTLSNGQTRNSPTLLYASLQKGFFYDNRSGSLEGQIISVINNKTEFHTDLTGFENSVKQNEDYIKSFQKVYNQEPSQEVIRNAIASFIKSLTPFNSKFDKNMNSLENSLTDTEINGFNLFMGKAKCATCHFAPTFNGTVPTYYKETELELIGVPKSKDTINATIDDDLGRYYLFNTPERKHFFKTPTVRNVSKTAPYMHNGVYTTLEEVIDFYNKGGGAGLGIELENQTLPPDNLNLSKEEIKDLVAFLNSLKDEDENQNINL